MSWWHGDGDANDALGVNDGNASGTVTYVPGMVGTAFHFSGGGYIVASGNGLPINGADRTLELWARFQGIYQVAYYGLFAGYGIWGNVNGTFEVLMDGVGNTTNSIDFSNWGGDVTVPTRGVENTWYHVAVTLRVGGVATYLRGRSPVAIASGQSI